jgi:hypothetical protein
MGMIYDLDINDIDSVQFVNHYMPLEQDMQILTDDEFDTKLEELLEFVFGPEPIKYILFWYNTGKEWVYTSLQDAYDAADWLRDHYRVSIGYSERRPYTNEIVVGIIQQEYALC